MNALLICGLNLLLAAVLLFLVFRFLDPDLFAPSDSMAWVLVKSVVVINGTLLLLVASFGWNLMSETKPTLATDPDPVGRVLRTTVGQHNLYTAVVQHRHLADLEAFTQSFLKKTLCRPFEKGFLVAIFFAIDETHSVDYAFYSEQEKIYSVNEAAAQALPNLTRKSIDERVVFDTLHDLIRPPDLAGFDQPPAPESSF